MSITRYALATALLLSASSSFAQSPSEVSFQGYLTDNGGTPIDKTMSMTFKLYKSGVEIWSEAQSVPVVDGLFNVVLGESTPMDTVAFSEPIHLGVTVAKDPEMPRILLVSAASARSLPGLYTYLRSGPTSTGYNVIGGVPNNVVGPDAVAATVFGGATTSPNELDGNGATVGGGVNNAATAIHATVGGGAANVASSNDATIGGGKANTVSGGFGWIGGGWQNTAGPFAAVAGGTKNEATGWYSMAAGRRARATHTGAFVWADSTDADFTSTSPNQFLIRAGGGVGIGTDSPGSPLTVNGRIESISSGFKFPDGTVQTTAAASVTDYWKLGGNSGTTAETDFIGTTDGEPLVLSSTGGIAVHHASPDADAALDVNGPIRVRHLLGGTPILYNRTNASGTPDGDGFRIRFDPNAIGAGKGTLLIEKTDNANPDPDGGILFTNVGSDGVTETAMSIRGTGNIGMGVMTPSNKLQVVNIPSTNSGNDTDAYVSLFQNPSSSVSADGIAVKIGTTGNPGTEANFIGFFDGDTGLIGQIEGNGSGGVSYNTTSADYAELLPLLDPVEVIEPGDVVGIFAGRVSRRTEAADQILAVTDRPAVLGNMPAGEDIAEGFAAVSFIGQVPVKVRGPIMTGDFLVDSGLNDGVAVAVHPETIAPDQLRRVFATAWGSKDGSGISRVNAAIGVDQAAAVARIIAALHTKVEEQRLAIESILARLAALEAAL